MSDIPQITPSQVAAWAQAQSARPVLLDVREEWELQTAQVCPPELDALHLPMQTIPARLDELDRQRPVACLCHHGMRSLNVARYLSQQGFDVVNIAGGIHAWSSLDPNVPTY